MNSMMTHSVRSFKARVAVAVCVILFAAASSRSDVSMGLEISASDLFRQQVDNYWPVAEREMGEMVGSYEETATFYTVGKYVPRMKLMHRQVGYAFDAVHMCARYQAGPPLQNDPTIVFATNSRYKFEVHRSGIKDAFKLADFHKPKIEQSNLFSRVSQVDGLEPVWAAEGFEGLRFSELLAGKYGMSIRNVRYIDTDAGRRILLEYDWARPKDPKNVQVRCTATLNPAMHCAVEKWERVSSDSVVNGQIELTSVGSGVPFPRTYTKLITNRRLNATVSQDVIRLSPPSFGHTELNAADSFALPAYGLPVPGEVSIGSKVVMFNVIGFVALGIILAVWARRRKSKAEA